MMPRVPDEQIAQWRAAAAFVDPPQAVHDVLDALEQERASADQAAALAVAAYDGNALIAQANARFDELAAQMRTLAEEFESGEYSAIDVGERILDTLDGKEWSPR